MLEISDALFDSYKTLIYNESGISFTKYNRSILESRIANALKEKKIESPETFLKLLNDNKQEFTSFIDSITTNLTKFFRNDNHFHSLNNEILPELIKRAKEKGKIVLWSAGCSTGEEPYSLLISLLECLGPDASKIEIKIYASDISLKTLMVAKQGFYDSKKVNNVPKAYLDKYFEHMGDGYQIKSEYKKYIIFDFHNLLHHSNQKEVDMVVCRNVIIYFDEVAQKKVIDVFYGVLRDQGYLLLGHSESLFFMETQFKVHKTQKTTLYQK